MLSEPARALTKSRHTISALELIGLPLHASIAELVRGQFLLGEHENAVFLAFREVEIRVRKLGNFPDKVLGVALMQQASRIGGPLVNPELDPGEQTAIMNLFSGAFGAFKNPSSHRQVDYGHVTIAVKTIMLTDLLLGMLDDMNAGINSPPTAQDDDVLTGGRHTQ